MSIQISFPGGVAVAAQVGDFEILTDQPVTSGGQGQAPSPYDFFLSSIGTCAGFFALQFCRQRELPTEGLGLTLDIKRDPETRALLKVMIDIHLPEGFPEKYQRAIIRATEQCSVKKALSAPPEFLVRTF
ncbi:OsmC family protein [Malonomonas rubra]|uniref:OsmC family protein n=1 Tax=Malonomonas rubra TaxID=57040 RepID=UPI0026ED668F|nr:OsmC family protein [Malonomonas rubra]